METRSRTSRLRTDAILPILIALLVAALVLLVGSSQRAWAAYPGLNGDLAFVDGGEEGSQLWAIDPADPVATLLTEEANWIQRPSFSADGTMVAFTARRDLFAMDADGSDKRDLFEGSADAEEEVRWETDYQPEDGGETIPVVRISTWVDTEFTRSEPAFTPDGSELLVVETDSTRTFTDVCAVEAIDGECIWEDEPGYYESNDVSCEGCGGSLVTVDAQTGEKTGTVLAEQATLRLSEPTVAADGTVAFTGEDDDGARIYLTDLDGAPPVAISAGPEDRDPDLTPDGESVLFTAEEAGLKLAPVGGGGATDVPLPLGDGAESTYILASALSPDGSTIAVAQVYEAYDPFEGIPLPVESGLYTVGLDGSDLTRVSALGYDPAWQPISVPAEEEAPEEEQTGEKQPADAAKAAGGQAAASAAASAAGRPADPWAQRKRRVKLGKKSRAVVGWVNCGGNDCRLRAKSARVRVGKQRFGAKVIIRRKSLGPGRKAAITIKLRGTASRAALKRAGKGKVVVWVKVGTGASSKALSFRPKLIPPHRWLIR